MDRFYDFLKEKGIIEAPDALKIITDMDPGDVIDFAVECYMLTESSSVPTKEEGAFNFSVNSQISGGVTPCSDPDCRINNSYDLASFAALYGERIYIPNPFEHIYRRMGYDFNFDGVEQVMFFVNQIVGDVMVLMSFKPLFEKDIIRISPNMVSACRDCWDKMRADQGEFNKTFESVQGQITDKVLGEVSFSLDPTDAIVLDGPQGYIGAEVMRFGILPGHLKKFKGTKRPYVFSKEEVEELCLHDYFIGIALDDVMAQKFFMDGFNTSYLTNRGIEADIIKLTGGDVADNESRKLAAITGMAHDLPFVRNASLNNLLELRESEAESFAVYRDAMNRAIKESENEDSIKLIKELVTEVIEPELNKIEQKIKNNSDMFKERLGRKMSFNNLTLYGGLFASNFFGLDPATVLTLGGVHLGKDLMEDYSLSKQLPEGARNSDFYYLWQLK